MLRNNHCTFLYLNRRPMEALPRCRFCVEPSGALGPTYASVLLLGAEGGSLLEAVEKLEREIRPGVTAVCPDCHRISILIDDPREASQSCVRSLSLWERFGRFLV